MVDQYDPLWLEFLQSLNTTENPNTTDIQANTTQSTATFDRLFHEDDDEEFIGPDEENPMETIDDKKLRVSSKFLNKKNLSFTPSFLSLERELALLLKDSNTTPDNHTYVWISFEKSSIEFRTCSSYPDEELLPSDQYESLWTEFLASLQKENDRQQDEQQKSIITTTTEDDDIDDDPEFRLPDTDYDVEDDLGDELHVSSKISIECDGFLLIIASGVFFSERELALLLEDNASIFNTDEFINPDSVSSTTTTTSTIPKNVELHLTADQRNILQYQLSAVSFHPCLSIMLILN